MSPTLLSDTTATTAAEAKDAFFQRLNDMVLLGPTTILSRARATTHIREYEIARSTIEARLLADTPPVRTNPTKGERTSCDSTRNGPPSRITESTIEDRLREVFGLGWINGTNDTLIPVTHHLEKRPGYEILGVTYFLLIDNKLQTHFLQQVSIIDRVRDHHILDWFLGSGTASLEDILKACPDPGDLANGLRAVAFKQLADIREIYEKTVRATSDEFALRFNLVRYNRAIINEDKVVSEFYAMIYTPH